MSNWRQIQARIRKAKNSTEPSTKLADLYAKTRDAMVAFELAAVEEKAEHTEEAIRWYTTAYQRFRRADWKKRAEDALTRLGAPIPEPTAASAEPPARSARAAEAGAESDSEAESAADAAARAKANADDIADENEAQIAVLGEIIEAEEEEDGPQPASNASASEIAAAAAVAGQKRRRRGRRGGRGRRRKGAGAPSLPAQTFAPHSTTASASDRPSSHHERKAEPPPPSRVTHHRESVRSEAARVETGRVESSRAETTRPDSGHSEIESSRPAAASRPSPFADSTPTLPSERVAHGRGGDPAVASRLAHLESMLRRLLGSQLHPLDEADEAPAGPGVFLLSDSDLVTSYYVESCRTLRVAIPQLVRSSGGGKGRRESSSGSSFRAQLAEHLGINEAKVTDYLKKHCVVRWVQLDEEAAHFAHFAIGVLRTPLNAE